MIGQPMDDNTMYERLQTTWTALTTELAAIPGAPSGFPDTATPGLFDIADKVTAIRTALAEMDLPGPVRIRADRALLAWAASYAVSIFARSDDDTLTGLYRDTFRTVQDVTVLATEELKSSHHATPGDHT